MSSVHDVINVCNITGDVYYTFLIHLRAILAASEAFGWVSLRPSLGDATSCGLLQAIANVNSVCVCVCVCNSCAECRLIVRFALCWCTLFCVCALHRL